MTLNRIKFLVFIQVMLFISVGPLQAFAGVDGSPFEGPYLGITTSKSTFSSTIANTIVSTADKPSLFGSSTSAKSKNSYGGGIFAGYGLNYGPVYTSAEAGFIVDKGNTILSNGTNTIKFSQSNTFELNVRAGFHLTENALIFGMFGYSGANMKSHGIDERSKPTDGLSYNQRLTSLRYGAGVEVAVYENISLRGEYTKSKVGSDFYLDGSDKFTISPKTSRIMFSVVLHMY
ncbi:MAG: porin family protein [Kordiimonadaceae bacterium]|jgi:opacity protein-like surface antigen|nr:porin family protein [Kordiimonadaceae bacterium]